MSWWYTQVRALVVVPSQELASQVTEVFSSVMAGTALRVGALSEDILLVDKLSHPPSSTVDVLISTPGKLTEHLSRYAVCYVWLVFNSLGMYSSSSHAVLRSLHYLILDEADKLLKQSSSPWLPHLLAVIASHKTPRRTSSLKNTLIGQCACPHELMLLQSTDPEVRLVWWLLLLPMTSWTVRVFCFSCLLPFEKAAAVCHNDLWPCTTSSFRALPPPSLLYTKCSFL